jgi:hypothetical protein
MPHVPGSFPFRPSLTEVPNLRLSYTYWQNTQNLDPAVRIRNLPGARSVYMNILMCAESAPRDRSWKLIFRLPTTYQSLASQDLEDLTKADIGRPGTYLCKV